jgi:hypothetical protein
MEMFEDEDAFDARRSWSSAAAAFVPLAAGLYLVTTTAWSAAERHPAAQHRSARGR